MKYWCQYSIQCSYGLKRKGPICERKKNSTKKTSDNIQTSAKKHHYNLLVDTMINSKRLRPKTNTSNPCWSTLVINFNSLKVHPISKITLSIHKKKEAVDPSAADGRGMKPKILGGGSMATFSVVPCLITVLNFDCVKRSPDMLL